jgi:hypothetical protein
MYGPTSYRSARTFAVVLTILLSPFATNIPAQAPTSFEQAWQSGTPVTVTGVLTLMYADDFASRRSELVHMIRDERTGRSFQLRFDKQLLQNLRSGTVIRVRGRAHGSEIYTFAYATSSTTASTTTQATLPAAPVVGEQRTVVLLVNFPDNPVQPYTVADAQNAVFTTTSNFYREGSFQQTWLAGDVFGWFTIALSSQVCDPSTLASLAQQAARSVGVDLSRYARYVYMFPTIPCVWSGMATVSGTPSESWINDKLNLYILAHEIGHNFGLLHAHAWYCPTSYVMDPCTWYEYGDFVNAMGNKAGHFNGFDKEQLGWLGYKTAPPITTVLASGTYDLEPFESVPAGGAKALKIVRSTDPTTGARTWYYVESRRNIGFDSFLSGFYGPNVVNGVMIRTGTDADPWSSNLLDMTPETSDFWDPALEVGRSFTDPNAGVTITTTSFTSSGASITVALSGPPCSRGTPLITVSPGQSQWQKPGNAFRYTVSVTSTDSASCAAAPFALTASAPSGWASAFGSPILMIDPGSSISTTLQVTSSAIATDGLYQIWAAAATDTTKFRAASATYAVASSLSVQAMAAMSNRMVSLAATVRAGSSPASGASVNFKVTKPSGSVVTGSGIADANGIATCSFRLGPKDLSGMYQVGVTASMNGIAGSGATSFTVK